MGNVKNSHRDAERLCAAPRRTTERARISAQRRGDRAALVGTGSTLQHLLDGVAISPSWQGDAAEQPCRFSV